MQDVTQGVWEHSAKNTIRYEIINNIVPALVLVFLLKTMQIKMHLRKEADKLKFKVVKL